MGHPDARENGVMWPQLFQTVIRHHLAMLAVKVDPQSNDMKLSVRIARSKRLQNGDTGLDNLRPDAIGGERCDFVSVHLSNLIGLHGFIVEW